MIRPSGLLQSLLRSSALRAAAAFGVGGLALACGNLLLARCLPAVEFAHFSLLYAIVMIGISIGPIGADVLLMRRSFQPDARLHRQILLTSGLVAAVLVLGAGVLYALPASLLATIGISIIAGGVKTVAVAHYRSRGRLSAALLLTSSTNATVLVAAAVAFAVGARTALLPAAAMSISLCLSAIVGWWAVRPDGSAAGRDSGYSWSEGWSAVSFAGAVMILGALERLVTPRLLGLHELATFSVLATIAGSPFQMLQSGVGYTLVPALRNAESAQRRRQVIAHEARVVFATGLAAGVGVWLVAPFILKWVLAGRYEIGWPLMLAAIVVGALKIANSLVAAAVSALGSGRDLSRLSAIGWISIGLALVGGTIGSRWGLTGLVCGVGMSWLLRAFLIARLAAPHIWGVSDHGPMTEKSAQTPGAPDGPGRSFDDFSEGRSGT